MPTGKAARGLELFASMNSDRLYVSGCKEVTTTQRADQPRAAPVYARVQVTWRVAYC